MNDCVFYWIRCCECEDFSACKKYIPINSQEGTLIEKEYEAKSTPIIIKALKELRNEITHRYGLKNDENVSLLG